MELQHVNIKLPVEADKNFDLELLIPIFHSWIQGKVFEERLLDIADYRHVHNGPGIILIGFEADYSVDNTDGHLGVRYNRKVAYDGENIHRLRQATRAALEACKRLEEEDALAGKLNWDRQNIEIFVNDRLLAPNTAATRSQAEPEFRSFFKELFGESGYSLSHSDDPRKLFGFSAKATHPSSIADLLAKL